MGVKMKQGPGQQDYTAAVARLSGEVVELPDGRSGVVQTDLAIGVLGSVRTLGIIDADAASATLFDAGADVFYDTVTGLAVPAVLNATTIRLGTAVKAKVSGETVVRTDLNVSGGTAGAQGALGGAPYSTRVVSLDHADSTEHVLIDAADNPNGLVILSSFAKVTEAPAGSSQDQMIVQLLDEDDNVLTTLTTTNTTPDAVGDLIQGTLNVFSSSTGVVLAVVPPGKALKCKVSQATAGTPAGALDVRALVLSLT